MGALQNDWPWSANCQWTKQLPARVDGRRCCDAGSSGGRTSAGSSAPAQGRDRRVNGLFMLMIRCARSGGRFVIFAVPVYVAKHGHSQSGVLTVARLWRGGGTDAAVIRLLLTCAAEQVTFGLLCRARSRQVQSDGAAVVAGIQWCGDKLQKCDMPYRHCKRL